MELVQEAIDLINFIDESPTPFQVCRNLASYLKREGFVELNFSKKWKLENKGKYFAMQNYSSIFAFTLGDGKICDEGFKIIGAHTDSPSIMLKPNPEIIEDNIYVKLNTEAYGASILNTWLDRPLSLAGRIIIKGKSIFHPETLLINIKKPIALIPNLPIHINKEVNLGLALNKQIDMEPILSMINKEIQNNFSILELLSKEAGVSKDKILDFDLQLYEYEKGCILGVEEQFISASRMDDLAMAYPAVVALTEIEAKRGINLVALFDNEEVGSLSKQGADSELLSHLLERIVLASGGGREDFLQSVSNSFMISADMAHGVHPNRKEKYDVTCRAVINQGPVIKISGNQSYSTEANSAAIYEEICKNARIPYQRFANRSDEKGGASIGPIVSSHLEISTVDIGNPILAMHSIRELGGALDQKYVTDSFREFYKL